ncbi:molybdenum ABC transporter ATP-binding protein [Azospirillum halopraeferens]|uniref:molybdenum ABC transporter ATP-binding protein n=1 Tax=Azospirillum halopraeferens TaxID=34010 RepID=UPI00041337DB|nr:molybdenum ABC transporter ATP-binding protein [Azospirillum halopraeferens]
MLDVAITRRLGAFRLDARFTAGARGVTALFGPSGSGKTSIVAAIAGLTRPEGGHIRVDGVTFFDAAARVFLKPEKRRVGYVFQDARLFPHMTVRDNLLYGWRRVPAAERRIAPEPVVALLGLDHLVDRRPATLSGGEKQRVALGRALLAQPRLLLLDEPMASLDAQRKAEILPYIERLRDELAIPIILVSHAIEEVVRLADTLVLVKDGRVQASGPMEEVLGRLDLGPMFGAHALGSVVGVRVAAHDDADGLTALAFDGGELTVPRLDLAIGTAVRVRIPARDVVVALEPLPERISVHNRLRGRITEIAETADGFSEVRIRVGSADIVAHITRHAARRLELTVGQEAAALVKSVAFDRASLAFTAGAVTPPRPGSAAGAGP